MIKRFRLPDLGEGLTESEIVTWKVAEGEQVALDQALAEVETAKAVVELPSPCAGVVEHLHAAEGEVVEVGSVLVTFRVDEVAGMNGSSPTDHRPPPVVAPAAVEPAAAEDPADQAPLPNLVGYGVALDDGRTPVRRPRRFATVSAGTGGAALDVRPSALDLRPRTGTDGVERVPVRGVRRTAAAALAASAAVPQVTLFSTVDVTPTVDLLTARRDVDGHRPTFLAAVARALCLAVRRQPEVNARWDDAAQEIMRSHAVHLGVAVAAPRGLLVPVLRDADREDLTGLARRIRDAAETARAGRSTPTELGGGTITVSNVGVFGVGAGTPLLHDGQAAILAVGAVARRPWAWHDEVALRSTVTLSLTVDHRVLDGEQGGRFLTDLAGVLADPSLAFVR